MGNKVVVWRHTEPSTMTVDSEEVEYYGVHFIVVDGVYTTLANAIKAVPSGTDYGILDSDDMPDKTYRNYWTVEDDDLTETKE